MTIQCATSVHGVRAVAAAFGRWCVSYLSAIVGRGSRVTAVGTWPAVRQPRLHRQGAPGEEPARPTIAGAQVDGGLHLQDEVNNVR